MNTVFLRGRLSRPVQRRVLESGTVIVNYEVTARRDDGPADTVPVIWQDPPPKAHADEYDVDDEIIVVGRVRRRFFRAGGATQSRTEVVVEALFPSRQEKRATTYLAQRCDELVG